MKRILAFLLTLSPLALVSQVDIVNISLTDSTLNYLYIGVNNKVRVTGTDGDLGMTSSSGKVVKDSASGIFYVTEHVFTIDTLKVYRNGQLILAKDFITQKVNTPRALLSGLKDSTATLVQIVPNPVLTVHIPNCEYNFSASVSSFKVSFYRKTGALLKSYEVKGNKMSGEHLVVLKQLMPGDKIKFSDIKVSGTDTSVLFVKPLTVTIK
ncbi:MAG: GldM family protein [Bacteroidota bacterium]